MRKEQGFKKEVIRRMTKAGFECDMQGNHFVITKDGKPFEVRFHGAEGWRKYRVHFHLSFALEGMEKVQPQGLIWLTSECNNHSDYTTTHLWSDHFSCRVETTVRSLKEFVREFDFAYKQIDITFNNLAANFSNIQEQFRLQPERRRIGFLADRYQDEENIEACKLVAQTNNTFANENKTKRV